MQKILFIDRDGTLVLEPADEQIDSFAKLEFYPGSLQYLPRIAAEFDYELIMISNQDGLGTKVHPEENFFPVHNFILKTFQNEGVKFSEVFIDRTFARDNAPTRKPGTAMLTKFFDQEKYDLANSYVIGDRLNDVVLAKNLGCKALWINQGHEHGNQEFKSDAEQSLKDVIALKTTDWKNVYEYLKAGKRETSHTRNTKETQIEISLNLDGKGDAEISTGIHFFDHMLDQIARHGSIDLKVNTKGDLHIDEHHTIEDTGIALGEAFAKALGDKRGIERYGFCLPMDDCLAQVAIDLEAVTGLCGMQNLTGRKLGKCLQKCSTISLNRFRMLQNRTST